MIKNLIDLMLNLARNFHGMRASGKQQKKFKLNYFQLISVCLSSSALNFLF